MDGHRCDGHDRVDSMEYLVWWPFGEMELELERKRHLDMVRQDRVAKAEAGDLCLFVYSDKGTETCLGAVTCYCS